MIGVLLSIEQTFKPFIPLHLVIMCQRIPPKKYQEMPPTIPAKKKHRTHRTRLRAPNARQKRFELPNGTLRTPRTERGATDPDLPHLSPEPLFHGVPWTQRGTVPQLSLSDHDDDHDDAGVRNALLFWGVSCLKLLSGDNTQLGVRVGVYLVNSEFVYCVFCGGREAQCYLIVCLSTIVGIQCS